VEQIVMSDKQNKADIKISKTDMTNSGVELAGAKLTVTMINNAAGEEVSDVIESWTSDGTVHEIEPHIARRKGGLVVGPQPLLRQTNDVFPEDLRIALQREGKHPVDREQIDDCPDNQCYIDNDLFTFACISHSPNPPL
jgi:hypothetical protein